MADWMLWVVWLVGEFGWTSRSGKVFSWRIEKWSMASGAWRTRQASWQRRVSRRCWLPFPITQWRRFRGQRTLGTGPLGGTEQVLWAVSSSRRRPCRWRTFEGRQVAV